MALDDTYEQWDDISVLAAEMRDIIEMDDMPHIPQMVYPLMKARIVSLLYEIDRLEKRR